MSATVRQMTRATDGADRHGRNPRPAPRRQGTRYATVRFAMRES